MSGTSGNGGFTPIEYPASEVATVPSPLYYPAHLREFGNDLEHHPHHHAAGSGEGERERAATKRPEPLMLTPPHNPDSEVVELLGGNLSRELCQRSINSVVMVLPRVRV